MTKRNKAMSRRMELETEIKLVKMRIEVASQYTPKNAFDLWELELEELSAELNNLYTKEKNQLPE